MFFALLPFLQIISCLATLWGVFHVPATNDVVVHYGVGADGPTAVEWLNSYGATVLGIGGWLTTKYFKNNTEFFTKFFVSNGSGSKTEIAIALAEWLINRNDSAATRRLGFAITDWLAVTFMHKAATAEDAGWWAQTLTGLRSQIAEHASPVPEQTVPPVQPTS